MSKIDEAKLTEEERKKSFCQKLAVQMWNQPMKITTGKGEKITTMAKIWPIYSKHLKQLDKELGEKLK